MCVTGGETAGTLRDNQKKAPAGARQNGKIFRTLIIGLLKGLVWTSEH
jgi:hypothetical protein